MVNMQKVFNLILGTLVQRRLEVQVVDLTCLEYSTSGFFRSLSCMVEFCLSIQSVWIKKQNVAAEK